jgi:hypothetical protein
MPSLRRGTEPFPLSPRDWRRKAWYKMPSIPHCMQNRCTPIVEEFVVGNKRQGANLGGETHAVELITIFIEDISLILWYRYKSDICLIIRYGGSIIARQSRKVSDKYIFYTYFIDILQNNKYNKTMILFYNTMHL